MSTIQDFQAAEIDQLRAELAEFKTRYRTLFESVPVGMVSLAQNGFIERANRRAEQLLCGGRLANQRMGRFIHTTSAAAFETAVDAVLKDGVPRSCELTLLTKRSARSQCIVSLHRSKTGPDGKVVLAITDQTETADAIQAATRARTDLRTLVHSNAFPMLVLGIDGYIRTANYRAAELLGTRPSTLEGEPFELRIVDASRTAFREQLHRRGTGMVTVDVARRGEGRRVQIQLVDVEWQNEPCLVASLEDVTELQQQASRDEREGRLASLGLLVAGVAHEVNNPLAFVVPNVSEVAGALRQVERGRILGGLRVTDALEMMEEAEQGLHRIATITRDLKNFHSTDDSKESLSLNEVVVDTLRLADSRLRQTTRVRRDLGALPLVHANRGRLGQVVLNLLINAADAMPEDRPLEQNRIRVRTWFENGVLHLEVNDNGKGISQQHLPNLFDPFFTTRRAGTGLGLAICANIVRDMGGWIEVHSEVNVGTQFVLCFPAADGQGPRRVLIISEEPLFVRGAERQMSRRYAIAQACGGYEAIRILQQRQQIDAIVSARQMQNGSGSEVYDWVSRHRSELLDRFLFMDDAVVRGEPRPLTGSALKRLLDSVVT